MSLNVYKEKNYPVNFDTLKTKRNWMDETFERHAYHCFPLSLANSLGWTFSFPEEISFIWRGKDPNSVAEDLEIISGEKYVNKNRANGTISFNTGLTFSSEENMSLVMMPVPNQFIDGVQCFTAIISTSVLRAQFPCAWKITKSNEVITIPANTPIAAILPISLKSLESIDVNLLDANFDEEYHNSIRRYGDASFEKSKLGEWTNFYRDAVDESGKTTGQHETKNIKLKITDKRGI